MNSIWHKISIIGLHSASSLHDRKAIILMNRMSVVLATFMLVFVMNAIILGDHIIIPFASFFCLNFLMVPVLLHRGFFGPAKWFFALTPIIEVSVIALVNGEMGGDKFYLMTTGVIPVMVFRSKWIGFLLFELSIICLFLVSYLQSIWPPLMHVDPKIILIYEYTNYLVICLILYLFTRYFKNDTERIENELVIKNEIITEKHKEITDSINYAERLQRSLMANQILLKGNLPNYFIYFNPKEAVSGDFYWASELADGRFVLVCADSTGHGVPGAIMSMMNMNSLQNSIREGRVNANEILNHTRKTIIHTLANDGSSEGGKDGMDAALIILDFKNARIEFALANNPLWIIREGQLIECNPDKMPVGKHDKQHIPFTNHELGLQAGDWIYIFTDGFADQFGGPKGKKFKYAALKDLLISVHHLSAHDQQVKLDESFKSWRGDLEQVDDVCIVGIRFDGSQ